MEEQREEERLEELSGEEQLAEETHGEEQEGREALSTDRLGQKSVLKLLLEFSIPAIIMMTFNALYNVVDAVFLGQAIGDAKQQNARKCQENAHILTAGQLLLEEEREAEEKPKESILEKAGNLAASLLDAISSSTEQETEVQTEAQNDPDEIGNRIKNDVLEWIRREVKEMAVSSYGFAGQDGSTLTMIITPGRTIPMLQHVTASEGSDTPDQVMLSVYIRGKWYSMSMDELMALKEEGKRPALDELPAGLVEDVFGKDYEKLAGIRSLDDALDLFTVTIHGGEIVELSSDGLDQVILPEPMPPEEKPYGTLTPGRKSRPKPETEETGENADEAA